MRDKKQRVALARRSFLLGAVLALSFTRVLPAFADGDEADEIPGQSENDENEFALQSVADGSALPLTDIMTEVQKSVPGELLEAKLKRHNGALVYVLTILSTAGIYSVVTVDAKDNKIVGIKEK